MEAVTASGVQISMGGRGCWLDNRFDERFWRSLKCEVVHLHELADELDAHQVMGFWLSFYNDGWPHSLPSGRKSRMAYERVSTPLARAV